MQFKVFTGDGLTPLMIAYTQRSAPSLVLTKISVIITQCTESCSALIVMIVLFGKQTVGFLRLLISER